MPSSFFTPSSRYYLIETGTWKNPSGKEVSYVKRRFLPEADKFDQIGTYRVKPKDRSDLVASSVLSDPKIYWQICDANSIMHPEEMTASENKALRLTLPEGVKIHKNA